MALDPGERIRLIQTINHNLDEIAVVSNEDAVLICRSFGIDIPSSWNWNDDLSPRTWALSEAADDQLRRLAEYFGAEVLDRAVSIDAQRRIWGTDGFRLFLSHTGAHANVVGELKIKLAIFGMSGFVAHADIVPPRDWQDEIENALNSCEALVAIMHEDFTSSDWTDQEVGFALGRGVLVVPMTFHDANPHGFLAKSQKLRAAGKGFACARLIMDTLFGHEQTQPLLLPHLVTRFERTPLPGHAEGFLRRFERATVIPAPLVERIAAAVQSNNNVASVEDVESRVTALMERHGYKPTLSTYDQYGEEPF